MRHALTSLRRVLTLLAAVCLGGWASVKLYAYVSTVRNEAALERMVDEGQKDLALRPSEREGPSGWSPADGTLLGRIDVPRIGVSSIILQGSGERWLEQAAGHIPGTALPGEPGNAAIAGHRDSVFRGLKEIRLGDTVEVTTPWVTRLYRVDAIRIVDATDTRVLAPTTSPLLTLITCYPFHYIGSAPDRFVVQASGVGSAAGTPVRQLAAAVSRERSPRHETRVHHVPALPTQTDVARPPTGSRLPEARPLTQVAPPAFPRPPKISWLRRLLHLGPKRHARR